MEKFFNSTHTHAITTKNNSFENIIKIYE